MIEQHYGDVRYLQFRQYLQFPEITHGIFTRAGGCSPPPYQALNTSRGREGDAIENVVHNRLLVLQALGRANEPCVTLWQVHGADVVKFDRHDEWRTDWAYPSYFVPGWTPASIRKGDALVSQERGVSIALSFGDCVPILFYDAVQHVIGIAHGGWRGTARGVVLATIEAMVELFGSLPRNIYAGIGPAIGACCYEVSEEVRQLFLGQTRFDVMPTHERYGGIVRESAVFSTVQQGGQDSLRLDLQATNRNQLLMAGLASDKIEVMPICTSCTTDRFFSHRREQGKTGRFAVVIALNNMDFEQGIQNCYNKGKDFHES